MTGTEPDSCLAPVIDLAGAGLAADRWVQRL